MRKTDRPLNVMEVSELCGVARSTVSHWIAKKGLPAYRKGKKFMVEGADLARFLRSRGYRVPLPLQSLVSNPSAAQTSPKWPECQDLSSDPDSQPLLSFVHQIRKPAFVFSGLRILACNQRLAELVGVQIAELVEKTMTPWIHPDSLEQVIAINTKRTQGHADASENYSLFLNGEGSVKLSAQLAISPLDQPENTWMAIVLTATAVGQNDFLPDSPQVDPDRTKGRG